MTGRRSRLATWYEEHVLAGIIDGAMGGVEGIRAGLLPQAAGRVCEIGFGTGANLPHYGDEVSSLVAVEPSEGLARVARRRLEAWGRPFELIEMSGSRRLPIDDASVDVAVLTFVLCSVKRIPELLAEVRRILRPAGPLLVAEHVVAGTPGHAAAQRALRPIWKACLGGCDPARDTRAHLEAAGFDTAGLVDFDLGLPWVVRPGLVGVARAPG
ncbi:MAG: methyltransferase domain-containing protein [Myxococcales bacterium]|nr:methyltransferase domain-containing protein [Myxococcales bacterium]MCB9703695.1 methyltransferase domain-containing protein [Myxococcales bacterium]